MNNDKQLTTRDFQDLYTHISDVYYNMPDEDNGEGTKEENKLTDMLYNVMYVLENHFI